VKIVNVGLVTGSATPKAAGETLDEGGLADAEIAMEGEGDIDRQNCGQIRREHLGLGGGSGGHAGAKSVEDRHLESI